MNNSINIISAIISLIKSDELKSVEDFAQIAKWASNYLGITFEQGIALVSTILDQELATSNQLLEA